MHEMLTMLSLTEQTISKSAYGTLEALAASIDEVIRVGLHETWHTEVERTNWWQIKIKLDKPIAVPLAEGAGIEWISPAITRP